MRSAVLLRQKGRKKEGRKKKERLDRKRNNTAQRGPRESNNEEESPGGGSQQNAADTNIMEIAMQMIIITNIPACVFLFLRAGRCTKKKRQLKDPLWSQGLQSARLRRGNLPGAFDAADSARLRLETRNSCSGSSTARPVSPAAARWLSLLASWMFSRVHAWLCQRMADSPRAVPNGHCAAPGRHGYFYPGAILSSVLHGFWVRF